MLELILFVLAMVVAGYLLRRSGLVSTDAAKDLANLVFYLTLPPLIFLSLRRAELSWSMLAMPAVAWMAVGAGVGLGLLLVRALRLRGPRAGAFLIALAFGNTTYFGYPIVQGFYGQDHLALAIFFDLLGALLATNSVGIVLASRFGHGPADPLRLATRLIRFPPLWALALGLASRGIPLPSLAESLLDRVGALTSPLIMLSIGMSLQVRSWRENLAPVAVAAFGRLLVLPALVFLGVRAAGLPLAYQQAAVLQAAMPTMFYSLTLALLFRLEVNLAVNAILASTLLSFLTLPLWHFLLGHI